MSDDIFVWLLYKVSQMAAQSNLTLNTKVYTPRGKNSGDIASWALVGDTTFGGATSIVSERVAGPSADGIYRVTFKVTLPKASTTDTACACAGSEIAKGIANVELVIPSQFTAAERADFTLRVQGLVANAIFTAAATNLEPAW